MLLTLEGWNYSITLIAVCSFPVEIIEFSYRYPSERGDFGRVLGSFRFSGGSNCEKFLVWILYYAGVPGDRGL